MFLQTEGSTGVDADKDKDEGRSKATKVYNNESLLGGKVCFSPFIFFGCCCFRFLWLSSSFLAAVGKFKFVFNLTL